MSSSRLSGRCGGRREANQGGIVAATVRPVLPEELLKRPCPHQRRGVLRPGSLGELPAEPIPMRLSERLELRSPPAAFCASSIRRGTRRTALSGGDRRRRREPASRLAGVPPGYERGNVSGPSCAWDIAASPEPSGCSSSRTRFHGVRRKRRHTRRRRRSRDACPPV